MDYHRRFIIAETVAFRFLAETKWEAPKGRRKTWRREKPGGGYEYREEPPEGKPVHPEQKWAHHVLLSKKDLTHRLSKGHFSVISAGRNPNDPDEAKLDPEDEVFHERHLALKAELEKMGVPYTEAVGHYGGKEPSLMVFHEPVEIGPKAQKSVMIHHADAKELAKRRQSIEELGGKFNQDSVLHGDSGKNTILFTTGKKKGQECGSKGWQEVPKAKDFFTDVKLRDKQHTKFALNIEDCFKRGML